MYLLLVWLSTFFSLLSSLVLHFVSFLGVGARRPRSGGSRLLFNKMNKYITVFPCERVGVVSE